MKAEKERIKAVKTKTAELHQNYRTTEINKADLKLKALKQEERRKQQETAEMWRQFKKLEIGQDEKLLTSLKQEERRRLQETERMNHLHQNNTIKESDMKLSLMRQEERKRMQEHEARLRKVNGHSPGFKKPEDMTLRRSSSHDNLKETKQPEPEKSEPLARKLHRRSSIGTVVSGDWKATPSWRNPQLTNNNPPQRPAAPVAAQSMENIGNTSVSSIQSLRSVFSKGSSTPIARPLYVRRDSDSTSLVADPIDQNSIATMDTTEPSERVEIAEQNALIESKAHTMKEALSIFSRNTSNASPLLPPRHNSHIAAQNPVASPDGTKVIEPPPPTTTPPLEQPTEKENGNNREEKLPPSHPKEKENDTNNEELHPQVKDEPPSVVKKEDEPHVVKESLRHPVQEEQQPAFAATPDPEPRKEETPVVEEEAKPPPPEDVIGDELLADPANIVRLDVLFSFGLLTSSDQPVFTNYMNAVEEIAKKTVANNPAISEFVWYDPVYPPFVQDYKTDGKSN